MKPDDIVNEIYTPSYVDTYENRFQNAPWFASAYQYNIEVYSRYIGPDTRWLDIGCGTGWHLRHFPETERYGLDLSPEMVERAREDNPGATIVEGNYLDPRPEWENKFDLITMNGWPYAYVDSLEQIEVLIENMARWCSPSGTIVTEVGDSEQLCYGAKLPWYDVVDPRWWGQNIVAIIWDWEDQPAGVRHERLICPQLGTFARFFGRYFRDLHVERAPLSNEFWARQKTVIASKKRIQPDLNVGQFLMEERIPPPDHPLETVLQAQREFVEQEPPAENPPEAVTDGPAGPVAEAEQIAPEIDSSDSGETTSHEMAMGPDEPRTITRRGHLWLALPHSLQRTGVSMYRSLPRFVRTRVRKQRSQ